MVNTLGYVIYSNRIKAIIIGMKHYVMYLSSWGRREGNHVSHGRNYVDSEGNKKRSNCWINGSEEGEYDSEEPYRDDHWKPSNRALHNALCFVYANEFLPHEVEWSARKPECYKLSNTK